MGATGALAFSSALTVASAYSTSESERAQGQFEKQQFDAQARLARLGKADAQRRGDIAAAEQGEDTRLRVGAGVAARAAGGVSVSGEGSEALKRDVETRGRENRLKLLNNVWREQWGLETQALQLESQGRFANLAAQARARNTLLTGGLAVARDFAAFRAVPKKKTT